MKKNKPQLNYFVTILPSTYCKTFFHHPLCSVKQIALEQISNVENKRRTRQEKDELIALRIQSDKSRKLFCIDQGLNYNSFVS